MSSLISSFMKDFDTSVFDNVESAKGCETFLFKAKTERDCWKLYRDFAYTVPKSKVVKAYRIGMRPDYPIPVARYFIEVCVDDPIDHPTLSLWTSVVNGRLEE